MQEREVGNPYSWAMVWVRDNQLELSMAMAWFALLQMRNLTRLVVYKLELEKEWLVE